MQYLVNIVLTTAIVQLCCVVFFAFWTVYPKMCFYRFANFIHTCNHLVNIPLTSVTPCFCATLKLCCVVFFCILDCVFTDVDHHGLPTSSMQYLVNILLTTANVQFCCVVFFCILDCVSTDVDHHGLPTSSMQLLIASVQLRGLVFYCNLDFVSTNLPILSMQLFGELNIPLTTVTLFAIVQL